MADRDYYEILGVKRDATAEEIRRAHRKLAREHHPDVNKSEDAAKRFQEIQEAYDVLGDEEARKKYDRVGHRAYATDAENGNPWGPEGGVRWNVRQGGAGGRAGGGAGGFDFESIMEDLFSGGREGWRGGARREGARARSRPTKGPTVEKEERIPFDLALQGGEHTVRVSRGGNVQSYCVKIPKGVHDGAKLRVKGAGRPSATGGTPGDLVLIVRILPHPLLKRDGMDLTIETPLTVAEATLGCAVELPTPGGRVTLTVPAGTASGSRLRLKGRGVEDAEGRRGDLYAVIKIVPPETLSDQDRALMEELGRRMPNPRRGRAWG